MNNEILKPVSNVQIIDRDLLKPNDYNPNAVSKNNLELLKTSILQNGWTLPIVCRPDLTIIDGFHRWLVSGQPEMRELLGGKVPIVIVDHKGDRSADMAGTLTHNRARGTHLLEPMKKIVKEMLESGMSTKEVSKQVGMSQEEIFRLSDLSREEFLEIMTARSNNQYSKALLKITTGR